MILLTNKVLVNISVPELDKSYDVFLPVNKKIGNIVSLLDKMLNDLSDGIYPIAKKIVLLNLDTEEIYVPDVLLINTTIRNGTKLMLITQ